MTKMVIMPIYGKNFKNILQKQITNEIETLIINSTSGCHVLQGLLSEDPRLIFDLFQKGQICFCVVIAFGCIGGHTSTMQPLFNS